MRLVTNSLIISNVRNQVYARDHEIKFKEQAGKLRSGATLEQDKRFLEGWERVSGGESRETEIQIESDLIRLTDHRNFEHLRWNTGRETVYTESSVSLGRFISKSDNSLDATLDAASQNTAMTGLISRVQAITLVVLHTIQRCVGATMA